MKNLIIRLSVLSVGIIFLEKGLIVISLESIGVVSVLVDLLFIKVYIQNYSIDFSIIIFLFKVLKRILFNSILNKKRRGRIDETKSFYAYKQMIHIEIISGNFDDAKFWAEDALKVFPQNIGIMEQLISIAKKQNDYEEAIKTLKQIVKLNPENEKNKERLKKMQEDR